MNFEIYFIIAWFIICLFILLTFYRWGKKALSIFPDINTQHVKYRDRFASGHSNQSAMTQMGGARNCLDVVVTKEELWLKSMLFFAGIGNKFDLIHKIPLKNIQNAKINGQEVIINFLSNDGSKKQVSITTKQSNDFIIALGL